MSFLIKRSIGDLAVLPSDPLVVTQRGAAHQAESGIIAAIDAHIQGLCRQMGSTTDSFRISYLRMEIQENEGRKRIVRRLFVEFWQREKLLICTFLRYKKGLLQDGQRIFDLAAEIDGLSTESLKTNYEQFRTIVLDDMKLQIAESVAREMYIHELQQLAHQIDTHAPEVERRLDTARRRYADTTFSE